MLTSKSTETCINDEMLLSFFVFKLKSISVFGKLQLQKIKHGKWFSKADYSICQSQRLPLLSSASPLDLSLDNLGDESVGLCLTCHVHFGHLSGHPGKINSVLIPRILLLFSEVYMTPLFLVLGQCSSLLWTWCSTCSRKRPFSHRLRGFGYRGNGCRLHDVATVADTVREVYSG